MFSRASHAGINNPSFIGTPSPERPSSRTAVPAHAKLYDYIVVGGGTAGCVLASRLSEDPSVTVLIIEAGHADTRQLMSRIPAGWGNLLMTAAEWKYHTVPQTELNGRELYVPRGKMLGGCSAINAQIFQHCSPEDYHHWESDLGATGWGWEDLKPYFRKSELHTPNPGQTLVAANRGLRGLVKTSTPPTNELTAAYVETGPNVGIPRVEDFNIEEPSGAIGIMRMFCMNFAGERVTTSTAYLPPAVFNNRSNLTILTGTTVTRILLAEDSDTCVGVEIGQASAGPRWDVFARAEVIVAMGAYGSPQLLQASGIGNKTELEALKIISEKHLPGVGEGLLDHLLVPMNWEAKKGTSLQFLANPVTTLPSLARWLWNGTGPLGTNIAEACSFFRSDDLPGGRKSSVAKGESNASGPTAPDIEIIDAPLFFQNHGMNKPPAWSTASDFFTLAPMILKPKSQGTVKLRSADMFDTPLIDNRFLSHPLDVKVLLEAMKMAREFAQSDPLKSLLGKPVAPESLETDEDLIAHMRAQGDHIYHPVGTCKIGAEGAGGVVDVDLRVHGIRGLRVCDASVFPDITSGHPVEAIIAVAERASDLIKRSRLIAL